MTPWAACDFEVMYKASDKLVDFETRDGVGSTRAKGWKESGSRNDDQQLIVTDCDGIFTADPSRTMMGRAVALSQPTSTFGIAG